MAAPKGNRFWELRSRHGRDILFATADILWEAACEYFKWCEDTPLIEVEQAKFTAKPYTDLETGEVIMPDTLIELPKMRAFTLQGLCIYLDCNTVYFNSFQPPNEDFIKVITRIREVIYNQKFTGAAAGFLNANIIARDLGLKDASDITTNGAPLIGAVDYSKLSDEVLQAIVDAKITKH